METPKQEKRRIRHLRKSMRAQRAARKPRNPDPLRGMLRIAVVLIVLAVAIVAFILLLRPSNQYLNSPEVSRAQRLGVLRVGVLQDMPGFSEGDKGLEVELARMLSARVFPNLDADAALELVPVNTYTALPKLDNDEADIIFAMQPAPNAELYASSSPYFSDSVRVFCLPGDEQAPLDGRKIGFVQGGNARAAALRYAENNDMAIEPEEYASYEDMCIALYNGNIRFIALPASHAPKIAQWRLATHSQPLGAIRYVAICALENEAFALLADLIIQELKSDGTLAAMIFQYGLSGYEYRQ